MEQPAVLPLSGYRYADFIETIPVLDEDFTGAAFKMQIRDRRDGGALRADLATVTSPSAEGVRLVYAGTDTIANHIAANRIDAEDAAEFNLALTDNLTLSLIGIRILQATMAAMPFAPEIGDNKVLEYDMLITPSGGVRDQWITDTFTVRAGAAE